MAATFIKCRDIRSAEKKQVGNTVSTIVFLFQADSEFVSDVFVEIRGRSVHDHRTPGSSPGLTRSLYLPIPQCNSSGLSKAWNGNTYIVERIQYIWKWFTVLTL
jgi:hypothetical protein